MKLGHVNFGGKEYPIVLTMRVLQKVQNRTGQTIVQELGRIQDNFDVDAFMGLFKDMLEAGAAYCDKNGIPHEETPALDDLYDLIGLDEFPSLFGEVSNVAQGKPEIEVVSKNP